eukprot:3613012-Amphidinium_carterae.1
MGRFGQEKTKTNSNCGIAAGPGKVLISEGSSGSQPGVMSRMAKSWEAQVDCNYGLSWSKSLKYHPRPHMWTYARTSLSELSPTWD